MGSWVTCVMGFPPTNFQLAMPFCSQHRMRHGTEMQNYANEPKILLHPLTLCGFYNSLLKKTDYRFYHFIIKWQHGKNNRTQYPKTKQPRKTKLFNLNTTQDQPHNHPLARPVQKRNKLSNVTQHMVHLDTCGTPSEWRWTWQILKKHEMLRAFNFANLLNTLLTTTAVAPH